MTRALREPLPGPRVCALSIVHATRAHLPAIAALAIGLVVSGCSVGDGTLDGARNGTRDGTRDGVVPEAAPSLPSDWGPRDAAPRDAAPRDASTSVTLGARVYARKCATCHGARGEGEPNWQEPKPDGSLPAPPHDGSGHTWHHSDAELLAIIADGGTVYAANSNMPAYRDVLTEREMRAVLEHIKSMWGPTERAYQAERTADWAHMMRGQTPAPRRATTPGPTLASGQSVTSGQTSAPVDTPAPEPVPSATPDTGS